MQFTPTLYWHLYLHKNSETGILYPMVGMHWPYCQLNYALDTTDIHPSMDVVTSTSNFQDINEAQTKGCIMLEWTALYPDF